MAYHVYGVRQGISIWVEGGPDIYFLACCSAQIFSHVWSRGSISEFIRYSPNKEGTTGVGFLLAIYIEEGIHSFVHVITVQVLRT